ncbi:enoyl-CoA delta isomerase 2-like [Eurosta solidaginis]|uniref:enoyl-CoA delta isomerase 2-like n=1 Tax=Eurosta solidaginis TaxID=178769 RepID=UPI003530D0DF
MSATNSGMEPKQVTASGDSIRARPTTSTSNRTALAPTKQPPTNGSYSELLVEQSDRICIITFNRVAACNALTRRGCYELIRALNDAKFNEAITTIVITGAAGYFTAGTDFTQTRNLSDKEMRAYFTASNTVLRYLTKAFIYCPKVLVAVVDGACIGIGLVIAALCDVIYCTERAYFQAPFTKLGICTEGALSYLLPQLIGRVKASELLTFGTRLSAQDALQSNLVARIVSNTLVKDELWPQLEEYSRLPAESLRANKRLLTKTERINVDRALNAECFELERLRMSAAHKRALEELQEHIGGYKNRANKSKL